MRSLMALFLIGSGVCAAQDGYVANAVGSSSSLLNVLAPEMLATIEDYTYSSPQAVLSHVSIRPAGSTQAIPATVTTGTTFLVPAGIPTGTAELIWEFQREPYESTLVTLSAHNFELSRSGPGGSAMVASVGLATPARPGQTIGLTGTGLGYGTQVSATIGGMAATVVYAGRGTPAGMDSIQLQIPAGVADGCYVPLVLNIGVTVVQSSISVTSTGAPCKHPLNLSLGDLQNLDSGGSLNVATVQVTSALNAALSAAVHRQESAYTDISSESAAQLAGYFTPGLATGCSGGGTAGGRSMPTPFRFWAPRHLHYPISGNS